MGLIPSSMGPLMEKRLGLQILAIPLELPAVPIYMIWHEHRRNDAAHLWLRELVVAKLGHIAKGEPPVFRKPKALPRAS